MDLRDRNVLVVGLARSGLGAARLCVRLGARVTVADLRDETRLGPAAEEMRALGVDLALGPHRDDVFLAQDVVVISPGVPLDQPQVAAARAAGIPVIGELELAAAHLACPVVAITGTNGKSTTTTFCGELLRTAGLDPFVGGNLGLPLSDGILDRRFGAAVIEVSSFQLETVERFHPRVAALLNLTEDHLDRYAGFDDYVEAKRRLFTNMDEGDVVVYNAADDRVTELVRHLPARLLAFSRDDHGRPGAFLSGGAIVLRDAGEGRPEELALDDFRVAGAHNVENLMAAVLCARALGVALADMGASLPGLRGLPHRMEWVRTLDGVDYYNDSKGTNVASTVKTLEGVGRPTVLLLGGKDKGGDYAPLVRAMGGRVRAAVVYGAAAPRIAGAMEGSAVPCHRVEDLARAVPLARSLARSGDAVLLSPACSSFDQFDDYEHRGEVFRSIVEALP